MKKIIDDKITILNKHNTKGILIQKKIKNKFYYLFQPIEIKNDNIPLKYRNLPFVNYNFENYTLVNNQKSNNQLSTEVSNNQSINIDNKLQKIKSLLIKIKTCDIYKTKKYPKIEEKIVKLKQLINKQNENDKNNKNYLKLQVEEKKLKNHYLNKELLNEKINDEKIIFFHLQKLVEHKKEQLHILEDIDKGKYYTKFKKEYKKSVPNLLQNILTRYLRYYVIDRLSINEKELLIQFVIEYLYFSENKSNILTLLNINSNSNINTIIHDYGLNHLYDFFSQTINYYDYNNKELYIFEYENKVYYRLIDNNTKVNNYYETIKGTPFEFKITNDISKSRNITLDDFLIEYNRNEKRMKYNLTKFFGKVINNNEVKFQDNLQGNRASVTGSRCTSGQFYYNGLAENLVYQLKIILADLFSTIFDIKHFSNKIKINKEENYILFSETVGKKKNRNYELFINKQKILKSIFKPDTRIIDSSFILTDYKIGCIYVELFLRLYRDIVKYKNVKNTSRAFNPQFWFFNKDETKLHFIKNEKIFVLQKYNKFNFLKTIHDTLEKIENDISLMKKKTNEKLYIFIGLNKLKTEIIYDIKNKKDLQTVSNKDDYELIIDNKKELLLNYINNNVNVI